MLAKELNLKIKIYSRADNEKMAKRLKTLGADYITIPEIAGAKEILEHLPV